MKTQNSAERRLLAKNLAAGCLLASILLLSAPWARSQTFVEAWVQRYSHPADSSDYAQKVVTDHADNVIGCAAMPKN